MHLLICNEHPNILDIKIMKPFPKIGPADLALRHSKYEEIRTQCKYYSCIRTNVPELNEPHLSLLHVNYRSILSDEKFEDFQLFIHKTQSSWHIKLVGFNGFFDNRKNQIGGGVAIYANTAHIRHSKQLDIGKFSRGQSLTLQCHVSERTSFIVSQIYKPPDSDNKFFLRELTLYLGNLNNSRKQHLSVAISILTSSNWNMIALHLNSFLL